MSRVIASTTFEAGDGQVYDVKICGRRVNRRWEAWIEFAPVDGAPVLRTPRETTQPTLLALEHWANALRPVYLEGALTRAIHANLAPHVVVVEPEAPFYEGPAPDPHAAPVTVGDPQPPAACGVGFSDVEGAVLDPISVYAKGGEDVLRRKLSILGAEHLRRIARGYRLVPEDWELDAFTESELVQLIVTGVRMRCAA